MGTGTGCLKLLTVSHTVPAYEEKGPSVLMVELTQIAVAVLVLGSQKRPEKGMSALKWTFLGLAIWARG